MSSTDAQAVRHEAIYLDACSLGTRKEECPLYLFRTKRELMRRDERGRRVAGADEIRRGFRHLFCGGPDVISGQIHMFPSERRQVGQQMVGDVLGLTADASRGGPSETEE